MWLPTIAALSVADYACHRAGLPTVSSTTRALFRTHHPVGAACFVVGWIGLSTWLVPHILKQTKP